MPGFIGLSVILLGLLLAGYTLRRYAGQRRRQHWRRLRDLRPVSGQWLADYRRGE